MLWHIEPKFCIWLYFTVLQINFKCCQFVSIFVGVMPLLELKILEIHSFPHFSPRCFDISSSSSSSGTRSPSIGFAGCIWCYIRRTHWPAIRNWRFYQAVLLWACLIAPTIFLGAECMTLLMPSLHVCMHVCGECWRVCNWSVCPGLGFHQLFIVPGHRKQCEHR